MSRKETVTRLEKQALSANSLKNALWGTLQKLQDETIDPAQANSIATQSREIMRVVKIEMTLAEMTGKSTAKLLSDFSTTG